MSEGLNLALYGMGTVFLFLTLLVAATMSMSALVALTERGGNEPLEQTGLDPKIYAAIGAAIYQHRKRKIE
jgi:oxaloacetate decarboxylase gamma subunit|tara:strand:- start:2162 stop:2374 length:213 start_codon:yes stop_codon:yes gene_type:complete